MHERTKELKKLMSDHKLTSTKVAELLGKKKNTVESWLSVGETRKIPPHALELLKYKIPAK